MTNFNKVILIGNLTRAVELRYGQSGKAYAKFGMAVNERFTTSSGEKKETTVFVDLTAFGKTAELINQYLGKGDPIFIDGKLDFSTWQDKATGANRSKLAVIVNNFQFIGSKSDDSGSREPAAPDATTDTVPF